MAGGQSFCSIRADRGHGSTTPGFLDLYIEDTGFGGTDLEPDGAGGPAMQLGGLGPLFIRQLGIDAGYGSVQSSIMVASLTLDLPTGTNSLVVSSAGQQLPTPDLGVPLTTGATSNLSVTLSGNLTMNGTPTILPPTFDGQLLIVKNESNGSGATMTLQDQGTLPGSGLSLHAATVGIPWKGAILFYGRFASGTGTWVQLAAGP